MILFVTLNDLAEVTIFIVVNKIQLKKDRFSPLLREQFNGKLLTNKHSWEFKQTKNRKITFSATDFRKTKISLYMPNAS